MMGGSYRLKFAIYYSLLGQCDTRGGSIPAKIIKAQDLVDLSLDDGSPRQCIGVCGAQDARVGT